MSKAWVMAMGNTWMNKLGPRFQAVLYLLSETNLYTKTSNSRYAVVGGKKIGTWKGSAVLWTGVHRIEMRKVFLKDAFGS